MAGKSDEGVSIDVNRLHVICPVRLKRLQFDEMYPCQFEDTELNFCLTSHGTVSCYLRGLDELDVISFVDDSFVDDSFVEDSFVGSSIIFEKSLVFTFVDVPVVGMIFLEVIVAP